MSSEYKTIIEYMLSLFESYQATALSEDLSKPVTAVKIGQYIPGASVDRPILYLRPETPGVISEMAGNMRSKRRLQVFFSGAVRGQTQQAAFEDAMCLANNVEQVLMNHATSDYWSGGRFGWSASDNDDGEPFGGWNPDPGTDNAVVHFVLRWSCEFMIGREAI